MSTTAFSGFTGGAVTFLKDLKANNNRDWFLQNKKTYEAEIKKPAALFSAVMSEELQSLTGQPHKAKVFRINRDVRFSKDKTPYNSHLHISFTPESELASPPAWMFGLSTEYFTLGCGVFEFDKTALDTYRKNVAGADGDRLLKLVSKLGQDGIRFSEPALKRVPSGFPQDHPHADLLRRKGLASWLDFAAPEDATGSEIVGTCVTGFRQLKPVFDALNHLQT